LGNLVQTLACFFDYKSVALPTELRRLHVQRNTPVVPGTPAATGV